VQILDFQNKELEVVVPEDQLSLAIGRKGQNVRLAAKLIGWHVDIRSEEEMKREVESQMEALLSGANVPLTVVESIDPVMSDMLHRGGIETVEQLAESGVDDVTSIIDMSLDDAERLIDAARRILEVKRLRALQAAIHAGEEAAGDDEKEAAEVLAAEATPETESDYAVAEEVAGQAAEDTAAARSDDEVLEPATTDDLSEAQAEGGSAADGAEAE
jgi:N utilization substance protein A